MSLHNLPGLIEDTHNAINAVNTLIGLCDESLRIIASCKETLTEKLMLCALLVRSRREENMDKEDITDSLRYFKLDTDKYAYEIGALTDYIIWLDKAKDIEYTMSVVSSPEKYKEKYDAVQAKKNEISKALNFAPISEIDMVFDKFCG